VSLFFFLKIKFYIKYRARKGMQIK